jgi:hypothetical protein
MVNVIVRFFMYDVIINCVVMVQCLFIYEFVIIKFEFCFVCIMLLLNYF